MIMGMGYQEDVIETKSAGLCGKPLERAGKDHSMENVRNPGKREARGQKKKEIPSPQSSRDKAARQMEQGVLEAAATDSRYSHLLNEEEEAIVKDVIKEFLT